MKYLKKFENFDLGRFNPDDEEKQEWIEDVEDVEDDECEICDDQDEDEAEEEAEDQEEQERRRVWGDEVVEKKKINAGFQAYLDKQKAKKGDKDSDKKEVKGKKDSDKKEDKKEDTKGLTAGQKKLPPAMQKAILAKKNKKK